MGAPSFSGGRYNKGSEVFDTEKRCQVADDHRLDADQVVLYSKGRVRRAYVLHGSCLLAELNVLPEMSDESVK